jgi:hypothetical protein
MIPEADFFDDSRGVSEVVGFILIFAIIVIVLSINQAQVVPSENKQVEFQHNEEVQGQLQDLRNGILEAAGSGGTQPVSIKLGTRFPARTVAVNPPPVSGRIETRAVGTPAAITVENVEAIDPETADYWNGTAKHFTTKSIVYEADYRVLSGTPNATVYENTLLYSRFESGATLPLTDQMVIEGNVITIVTIDGNLSESGTGSATLSPRAVSGPYTEIAVENTSGTEPINVTIPSTLDPTDFTNTTELPAKVTSVSDGPGPNRITLTLAPGPYTLRMAKIGVGTGVESDTARYLTSVNLPPRTLQNDTQHDITVEVRNRFNNPVTGFRVNASANRGSFVSSEAKTDADGHVQFTYQAPSTSGSDTLELSIYDGKPGRENVTFDLQVVEAAGAGGGGVGGDDSPRVQSLTLSEAAHPQHADFEATWSVSDPNGNLDTVELTLTDLSDDQTEDTATINVNGGSDSGTTSLRANKEANSGNEYEVEIVVTDTSGNTDTFTATEIEDGS